MGPTTRIAGLALTLALVGCGATPPALRVVDARMVERTDEGTLLVFTLEGENPNAVGLPLREVRYSLALDGERVFEGTRTAEATLPRRGVQRFELPAPIPAGEGGLRGVSRYRLAGTVWYIEEGQTLAELMFDLRLRQPSVMFADEGEIEFTPEPEG